MDNKITKSRLSDFLAYEWILLLIITIVSIIVWELAYTAGAVKLTIGQEFKYYYDINIIVDDANEFRQRLINDETFSYDVLKLTSEALSEENFVLGDRLSIQEGDVIFTDLVGIDEFEDEEKTIPKTVRAKSMVDSDLVYIGSLDQMVYNAKIYLTKNFFVDGAYAKIQAQAEAGEQLPQLITLMSAGDTDDEKILNSISDAKVENMFFSRNKDDNRFRDKEAIALGIKYEKERIVKLCENVLLYEEFVSDANNQDALFSYTRYSQSAQKGFESYHKDWAEIERQKNIKRFGKEQEIFGINIGKLKNGADLSKSMRLAKPQDPNRVADGIVVMTFDFTKYQPDLQYESLSFVCTTIRSYMGE